MFSLAFLATPGSGTSGGQRQGRTRTDESRETHPQQGLDIGRAGRPHTAAGQLQALQDDARHLPGLHLPSPLSNTA